MDVGAEKRHGGGAVWVEGSAQSDMATETHARSTNLARAGGHLEQVRNGQATIFVVRGQRLLGLVLVAKVSARTVVGKRFICYLISSIEKACTNGSE